MDCPQENYQLSKWIFKVVGFRTLSPFYIYPSKCYILVENGECIGRELIPPSVFVTTNLNILYADHRIFNTRRKLIKVLEKYCIYSTKIVSYLKREGLHENMRCSELDLFYKSLFALEVCFKKSDVVIFHLSGHDWESVQFFNNYLVQRVREIKSKSAIVIIDGNRKFPQTFIEEMPIEALCNFREWWKKNIDV